MLQTHANGSVTQRLLDVAHDVAQNLGQQEHEQAQEQAQLKLRKRTHCRRGMLSSGPPPPHTPQLVFSREDLVVAVAKAPHQ